MKTKRIKLKDRTLENDIKYGGYLSYRHIRIIGWLCLIIAQISLVLQLEAKLAPDTAKTIDNVNQVLSIIADLPVPLFLLANFSTIVQNRGNYKALFKKFGIMAAGMYVLANVLIFYYGFRTLRAFDETINFGNALRIFGELLPALGKTGYVLNIFIDMLLVVLMFFFMNYTPKCKAFEGKRIILFRLLVLLPIAYEVVAIFVKYSISMSKFTIPSPVFFLLPSKPPLIFAAFVVIVFCLKIAQVLYIRRHHSLERYEEYVLTKAHSVKVSLAMAIVFVIFAFIDAALVVGLFYKVAIECAPAYADQDPEVVSLMILDRLNVYLSIGIGGATGLILVAPLVLLYSYTKKHNNPKIDTLIPIAGIALLVFTIAEGMFEVITLNMPLFVQKIRDAVEKWSDGGTEPTAEAQAALTWIRSIHL